MAVRLFDNFRRNEDDGKVGRSEQFYADAKFGQDAVLDTGVFLGQEHPDEPGLFARRYSVELANGNSGSIVQWEYSSDRFDGGTFTPFDPIADLQAYSYSVGFETSEFDQPIARTITVLSPPPPGSPPNASPVFASAWGEIETRKIKTTMTRVSLRTSATSAQLGFGGTDKQADLAQVWAIGASVNRIITVGDNQVLFRIDSLNQATTPRAGNFSTARWDVEYTLLYDPGTAGPIGGLQANTSKNALFAWTNGDGSTNISVGYSVPYVLTPYQGGPSGRFQRPPYSEVVAVPDPPYPPPAPGSSYAIRDLAPKFQARALYDKANTNFFLLPGVP